MYKLFVIKMGEIYNIVLTKSNKIVLYKKYQIVNRRNKYLQIFWDLSNNGDWKIYKNRIIDIIEIENDNGILTYNRKQDNEIIERKLLGFVDKTNCIFHISYQ